MGDPSTQERRQLATTPGVVGRTDGEQFKETWGKRKGEDPRGPPKDTEGEGSSVKWLNVEVKRICFFSKSGTRRTMFHLRGRRESPISLMKGDQKELIVAGPFESGA